MDTLEISSGKRDLRITPPIMNATGILGFADESRRSIPFERLGALITNPLSIAARTPAKGPRFIPYQGGFLLHTGHPNPGCPKALRAYRQRWARAPIPIIPHLLAASADDLLQMVDLLEAVENVQALEIGLQNTELDLLLSLVSAAQSGELPVIVNVPMDFDPEKLHLLSDAGAHAFSMGPLRGTLPTLDGERITGRLYGPNLLPIALKTLARWRAETELPVIAAGGIYQIEALEAMFDLGAQAVQLDSILWTEPDVLFSFAPTAED